MLVVLRRLQRFKMSNLSELRIYISHQRIIISNEHGFRVELTVPLPGNVVVVTLGARSYHFGFFPPNPPTSPVTSDDEMSEAVSEQGEDPQNPIII